MEKGRNGGGARSSASSGSEPTRAPRFPLYVKSHPRKASTPFSYTMQNVSVQDYSETYIQKEGPLFFPPPFKSNY